MAEPRTQPRVTQEDLRRFVALSVRRGWPLESVLAANEAEQRAVFAALALYARESASPEDAARAFLGGAGDFLAATAPALARAFCERGWQGADCAETCSSAQLEAEIARAETGREARRNRMHGLLQDRNRAVNAARLPVDAQEDLRCMREAYRQAVLAGEAGEVPVGAIVARDGVILGRGGNRTLRDSDPTAHAEVVALREAARTASNHRLSGATLYVTLEPCVMCTGAAAHARIARVVYAAADPRAGALGGAVDLAGHRALMRSLLVSRGPMEEECLALLREFFAQRRREASALPGD